MKIALMPVSLALLSLMAIPGCRQSHPATSTVATSNKPELINGYQPTW